jgi:hypothetical protein
MKRLLLFFTIVLTTTFVAPWVFADEGDKKPRERRATMNFEDELVEGNAQKPDMFYLLQKKNFNYRRLVKLRENFLPEMRKTTEDVQRVRGGN